MVENNTNANRTPRAPNRTPEEQAAIDKRAAGDLNPEEQAAVDQAKRDLERSKSQIGQTPPLYDPLWLLTDEGKKVLSQGLGRDINGNVREFNNDRVTVVVPKTFTFTLLHSHKFEIVQGIREIPAVLADHPWFVGHGVTVYKPGAAPPVPLVLLGSKTMSDPVKVGDQMMPLGPFVVAAHTTSDLSVKDWNAKTDAERDAAVQAEIDKVAAAARPDMAPNWVPQASSTLPAKDWGAKTDAERDAEMGKGLPPAGGNFKKK
jgi:hypothetical protein